MKQVRRRKNYAPEFKAEAVRTVQAGTKDVSQIARELGVARQLLNSWTRQAERSKGRAPTNVFPGNGNRPADQAELDQLRREVAQLREDNEILKKATANSIDQRNASFSLLAGVLNCKVLRGRWFS